MIKGLFEGVSAQYKEGGPMVKGCVLFHHMCTGLVSAPPLKRGQGLGHNVKRKAE